MSFHDNESRRKEIETLLADLKSATDKKTSMALFNRVTLTLSHHHWFTDEQRASVAEGAKASLGLTNRQKKLNLPMFQEEDGRYTDEAYHYEGCDDYGSYD